MKKYEPLLVLKDEDAVGKVKGSYFKKYGIAVENEDSWGVRKLAYPIEKKDSGYYVLLTISIDENQLPEFRKQLELDETLLRSLIFSVC